MQYLSAKKIGTDFVYVVNMDETKLQEGGTPDPEYIQIFTWGLPPEGVDEDQYIENHKTEIPLLVANILNKIQPTEEIPIPGFS